ncbi:MAG TPA: zinc ribbon domain-containing protein [Puia sp.]|nr:zinc ribbon domain-containing protein [Puia sp.]
MEGYIHCQSCGMPLDQPELLGTEKDGSKSTIYCLYCYREGRFVRPDMTLKEMEEHVREMLEETHTGEATIRSVLEKLPHLTRWFGIPAIQHRAEWH